MPVLTVGFPVLQEPPFASNVIVAVAGTGSIVADPESPEIVIVPMELATPIVRRTVRVPGVVTVKTPVVSVPTASFTLQDESDVQGTPPSVTDPVALTSDTYEFTLSFSVFFKVKVSPAFPESEVGAMVYVPPPPPIYEIVTVPRSAACAAGAAPTRKPAARAAEDRAAIRRRCSILGR